ncbi:MAG: SBBP repeat-containing protein [Pseudomonadota bacterium]
MKSALLSLLGVVLLLETGAAAVLEVTRSTTLGGSGNDSVAGMAVGPDGSVYLTGTTLSADFAGNLSAVGEDVFVLRMNPDSTLAYVRLLSGNGTDNALAITVDGAGNAYVLAQTDSTDLPAPNGFLTTPQGETDAYVARFDASGNQVYGSYYGGPDFDGQFDGGITWDSDGQVYITSRTEDPASGLPTLNAYETSCAVPPCILLAGFDTNQIGAASLIYGGYAGGSGGEAGFEIDTDAAGNVYVFGFTESASDLVTAGQGFQDTIGSINERDHFLLKLDPAANGAAQLVYSTFIGGDGDEEEVGGFHVAANGSVWVTGNTTSTNLATPGAYQTTLGGATDAYLIAIDTTVSGAASRLWTTYLGGTEDETGWNVARANDGTLWVGLVSASPGLSEVSPLPAFFDVGPPAGFDDVGLLASFSPDGTTLQQLTRFARAVRFLPVPTQWVSDQLFVSASVSGSAFLGNAGPAQPAGARDLYTGRFSVSTDRGLTLDVEAGFDQIPAAGSTVVSYVISNRSLLDRTNVMLSADFPAGAAPDRVPTNCSFPNTQFTCTIGVLRAGEQQVIDIQATQVSGAALTFSATVSASETDPTPPDNADSATITIQPGPPLPQAEFRLAGFDAGVASADTGELLADSRFGIIAGSQGVDASALNLLRLGGGSALPVRNISNGGQVAFGVLDAGQWTPAASDTLDLTQTLNPAHRVFLTFRFPSQVTLWSAAPFTAPVQVEQALYDALSGEPVFFSVDTVGNSATLRQGSRTLISANPFVPGAAAASMLGQDQVVSSGFGSDFLGRAVLGPSEASTIFVNGFE